MRRMRLTVLTKMLLSYTVLTVVVTILFGVTAGVQFTSRFRHTLEETNRKSMERICGSIESEIILLARQISNNIVMNAYDEGIMAFFSVPLQGNHNRFLEVHRALRLIVTAHDDLLCGIEMYYERDEVVLDTAKGVRYLTYASGEDAAIRASYQSLLMGNDQGQRWILPPPEIATQAVSYVIAYPFVRGNQTTRQGLIIIDVKTEALSRILRQLSNSSAVSLYVVDEQGAVLASDAHTPPLPPEEMLPGAESRVVRMEDQPFLVSQQAIADNGWRLVRVEPIDAVYEQANALTARLIGVGAIALCVGICLAGWFSAHFYAPLRRLHAAVYAKLGRAGGEGRRGSEYAQIEVMIDDIAVEMSDLKQTLRSNEGLIKSNVLRSLMSRALSSPEALDQQLRLIGVTQPAHAAVIIRLDKRSMERLEIEHVHYVKYNLMQLIEGMAGAGGMQLRATEMEEGLISVWASCPRDECGETVQAFGRFLAQYLSQRNISLVSAFGGWVENITLLHSSYAEALSLLKYAFFLPDEVLLHGPALLAREQSAERIDEKWVRKVERALNVQSLPDVRSSLGQLLPILRDGNASERQCRWVLSELVRVLLSYEAEHGAGGPRPPWEDDLEGCASIREFNALYLSRCGQALCSAHVQPAPGAPDIVAHVKRHAAQNLSGDLSLVTVAELLGVKPGYLSRKFKEVAGVNYVEYITTCRVKRASEMLAHSSTSVSAIAEDMGFNSVTYFNRKFKAHFGLSPGEYRRRTAGA